MQVIERSPHRLLHVQQGKYDGKISPSDSENFFPEHYNRRYACKSMNIELDQQGWH